MNISIKQLQAFFVLAETNNFTRAAEKIHMSQPAFSNLIASLEHELGYKLFHRNTRKVQLNQHGLAFLTLTRNLHNLYDVTINEIKAYTQDPVHKLTLAVMPSVIAPWIPESLTKFNAKQPHIEIKLIDTQWGECLSALLHEQADFAITTAAPSILEIQSELLFNDPFYLVCHHTHPLAHKAQISLTDLSVHNLIGFSLGTSLRHYTDTLIEPLKIKYYLEITQLTTMLALVMANYGVGIINELSLFQFKHPSLVIKKFNDVELVRPVFLAYHLKRPQTEASEKFYHHLKQSDHYPVQEKKSP